MNVDLRLGDCLEILPTLADASVDAVVTDPPYGVDIAEWDDAMPTQDVLDDCLRISRGPVVWFGSSSLILNFARYKPQPDRLLIWSPKFTLLKVSKDGFAYRYHPIAVWNIHKQDVLPWDVIDDMTECGNWWEHPATKPLTLLSKLVSAFSSEVVLDPFMGSGTTGVACMKLNRNFIGIEKEPKYFEIAQRRISDAQAQLTLPLFDSVTR